MPHSRPSQTQWPTPELEAEELAMWRQAFPLGPGPIFDRLTEQHERMKVGTVKPGGAPHGGAWQEWGAGALGHTSPRPPVLTGTVYTRASLPRVVACCHFIVLGTLGGRNSVTLPQPGDMQENRQT